MKKWDDRKDLVFSHVCLVGRVEKWEGEIFFCLVREKKEGEKCNLYKLTIISLLYNSRKVRGVGECNKIRVFV